MFDTGAILCSLAIAACTTTPAASTGDNGVESANRVLTFDVEEAEAAEERWVAQLEPLFWLASPAGNIRLPNSGTSKTENVEVRDLNLDSPQLSASGELHINAGDWRFSFAGYQNSLDRRSTADSTFTLGDVSVVPGDGFDIAYDYVSIETTIGYRVLAHDFVAESTRPHAAFPSDIAVYVVGGARYTDISVDIEGAGARSETDADFFELLAGVRAELNFNDDFGADLLITGGGGFTGSDNSAYSVDILVGFHYRPQPNVGVHIGWRQIGFALDDGSGADAFEHEGTIAGIMFGAVIQF